MKKILRVLAVSVLAIFLVSGTALAVPIVIDFEQGSTSGGLISSDLLRTDAGIPLAKLKFIDSDGVPTYYDGFFRMFYAADNSLPGGWGITIDGRVPSLGLGGPEVYRMLEGTFTSFTANTVGNFVYGSGPDIKSPDLLSALGVPLDTEFAFLQFSLFAENIDGELFATSVDIRNTQQVPEPATMLLLGLGLVGLAGIRRKFKS